MVFKVFYQESITEVPIRENTKTMYIEGASIRDVRSKLKEKPYNVELVTPVNGAYLEYEKQSEDYNVLELG